jgi:hypothetical protein
MHTDIHALIMIRTHHPSVRQGEDSSYVRPRGHSDGQIRLYLYCNDVAYLI